MEVEGGPGERVVEFDPAIWEAMEGRGRAILKSTPESLPPRAFEPEPVLARDRPGRAQNGKMELELRCRGIANTSATAGLGRSWCSGETSPSGMSNRKVISRLTPLVDGKQPPHSTVTEDLEYLVCLRRPSDRNRMGGVVGC